MDDLLEWLEGLDANRLDRGCDRNGDRSRPAGLDERKIHLRDKVGYLESFQYTLLCSCLYGHPSGITVKEDCVIWLVERGDGYGSEFAHAEGVVLQGGRNPDGHRQQQGQDDGAKVVP